MAEFNARIRLKRDTSANWTANNPVLLNGERIIVDTDAGEVRYKTGDGIKTYVQLPFDDEAMRNLVDSKYTELQNKIDAIAPGDNGEDMNPMAVLADVGFVTPVANNDNAIFVDENGVIFSL